MDFEELQENLEPVTEALAKHKSQLILLALVAAVAYAYLYILPHPGNLTVQVSELDGGGLNDAEVTIIDDATGKTLATDLTQNGEVTFLNMPSKKSLTVQAAKGIAYSSGSTAVEIPSGAAQSASIRLERRNALSFGINEVPNVIPAGCADEFNLEVRNAGPENFDTEMIVEGGLEKVLSIVDGKKIAYYNSSTNFSVRAVVDASAATGGAAAAPTTGNIRIKKTNKKLQFSIKLSPKIEVQVSPNEVQITDPKERQKFTLRIFNSGQQPIGGIAFRVSGDSDLRQACNQNIDSCISIEQLSANPKTELLPQTAMLLSLILTPPNQPGKTFLGSLEMSAYCLRKNPVVVPITIKIPGQ